MVAAKKSETAAADAHDIEFRDVARVVDQARAEINACCEEEQESQRRVDQAKARREFIQAQARDAIKSMSDPAAFKAVMARRFYDPLIKAACARFTPAKGGLTDKQLYEALRAFLLDDSVIGGTGFVASSHSLAFYCPTDADEHPTLCGEPLLHAVRRVLGIPYPTVKPSGKPPANQPSQRPDRKPRHRTKPVLRDAAKAEKPAEPATVEVPAKVEFSGVVTAPIPHTALGLSLEELRQAVSLGELSVGAGQKTGLCRRVIVFSGKLYGVYGWEKAEADGETFTLMELVPVSQWAALGYEGMTKPESYQQRRARLGRVNAAHPNGLIVASPDGEQLVINEAVSLIVSGKGAAS